MDLKPVEAALTEVGKAFRLCRLYPPTHPSVQQALAELAVALPGVTSRGTVELRITNSGFSLGATPVAARNPQLHEFAGLLYAQGYRALIVEPGVSADEFGALARMAAAAGGKGAQSLGVQQRFSPLPHLKLEQGGRRAGAPPRESGSGAFLAPEPAPMGRRSMLEFRPDALPADIEAGRIISMLDVAAPSEAGRHLTRLGELSGQLLAQRDFAVFARAVAALARWAHREDEPAAARIAQTTVEQAVTTPGLAALVNRLSEPGVAPEERDGIVQALGAVGARAAAQVAEAFAAAGPEHRDLLLAIVRIAGDAAVDPVVARLDADARGEHARGLALMLGAAQSARAAAPLATLAKHAEPGVRAAAVAGLARLEVAEAERVVVGALRDRDAAVRIAAARGISWFGDPSVVPILLAHLSNEEDDEVVRSLAGALGELRDPRAVQYLADLARAVSGVFQRRPAPVRAAAVRALAAIGTDDAMHIVAGFRTDRQMEVRMAAEQAFQ
jgi:HEAT repeat protein